MSRPDDIQSLLVRRKLTRAIAEDVRSRITEYLTTLSPLLRPKSVLGDYVQGGVKEPTRKADKGFKELQALYERVATAKPFSLPRELQPPLDLSSNGLALTPLEYAHAAKAGGTTRTITVRCPLTWVLTYNGSSPDQLRELLRTKTRTSDELQRSVVSSLAIHVAMESQPGVRQILGTLNCPVSSSTSPEFGDLPLTLVSAGISTSRASDDLMVQSAELTGMDAFEEVVNVEDIHALNDGHKAGLLSLVSTHAPELAATT